MTTVSLSVRRTPAPGDVRALLLPGPRRATRRGVDDALATSHGSPGAENLRHQGAASAAALGDRC